MLEWVCPKCGRAVDPGFTACPFCHDPAASPQPAGPDAAGLTRVRIVRRAARSPFHWADVERGFNFGLGFIAALACAYFVLFLIVYFQEHHEWVDALARLLRVR